MDVIDLKEEGSIKCVRMRSTFLLCCSVKDHCVLGTRVDCLEHGLLGRPAHVFSQKADVMTFEQGTTTIQE